MAIEGQDTIKQVSRDSESPRYVLDGHITKVHKLKSGEDLKGNDANAAEDQARLVTQKLLQEAVEIQKPTPLGSAIQTVLPSEASITGFFHKNHKFYVEVGNEKRPSISIDDTDAGSALVLRIQGADSYKKFGAQGSRELGNKLLGLGGLLYGMGNEAQRQWTQNPVGAVLEGATNAALAYGLVVFEATAPHITSLASAALLGTVIGHFLGPEQRDNFAKLGRNYHQLSTADGMLAMDLVKQVAINPLNKDFYHLAYGLAAGAAAIKPGVGMRAEMPSHMVEQRAFQLSMKFLAASPKLAVGALKELPTMIQQFPALMQNMLNRPFDGMQLATIGGERLFMAKAPEFNKGDSSYAMSQLPEGSAGKGGSGAASGENGLGVERDWESELTGNTPFDEGRYMESEYTPDERFAIELGYPKDTPRKEIYKDLEEEALYRDEPEPIEDDHYIEDEPVEFKHVRSGEEISVTSGDYEAFSGSKVTAKGDAYVIAHDGSKVIAKKGSFVRAKQGAEVMAKSGSQVVALAESMVIVEPGSLVTAQKGSIVIAKPGSKVTAEPGAQIFSTLVEKGQTHVAKPGENVLAENGSTVTAEAGSKVTATEGAEVKALKGSHVMAQALSKVTAESGSRVEAGGGADVIARKGSFVTAKQYSRVTTEPGCEIKASSGSKITAGDGSLVHAEKGSHVTAESGSRVNALEGSHTSAKEGSQVTAYDQSTVYAFEGSKVIAKQGSKIEAHAKSEIVAETGSEVTAVAGSQVTAMDGSTVIARPGAHITTHPGATIYSGWQNTFVAESGAKVYAQVASEVIAKEGSNVIALNHSKVIAKSGSKIEAKKGSEVIAEDGAEVIAENGAKISASAKAKVKVKSDEAVPGYARVLGESDNLFHLF